MAAAPNTDLTRKCGAFSETELQTEVVDKFKAKGIDPARLIQEGPEEFVPAMRTYHRIHIALDPFPYAGDTTTCQALYMGTPVITLAGDRFSARMGACLLTAANHPEWIAQDKDVYIEIAVQLAADPVALRATRRALGEQMNQTPLCDIALYAADVGALLHQIADVAPMSMPAVHSAASFLDVDPLSPALQKEPAAPNARNLHLFKESEMTKTKAAPSAVDTSGAAEPLMDITTSR